MIPRNGDPFRDRCSSLFHYLFFLKGYLPDQDGIILEALYVPEGKSLPSQTRESGFPVAFTRPTIHNSHSSGTASRAIGTTGGDPFVKSSILTSPFPEAKQTALSNCLMIWLAPIAAPAHPDSLRNVLLFNFNLVSFFSFEPDMFLFLHFIFLQGSNRSRSFFLNAVTECYLWGCSSLSIPWIPSRRRAFARSRRFLSPPESEPARTSWISPLNWNRARYSRTEELPLRDLDAVEPAGDLLEDGLRRIERDPVLLHVGELHRGRSEIVPWWLPRRGSCGRASSSPRRWARRSPRSPRPDLRF